MTLREMAADFVQFWQDYHLAITTNHVLDWSIGHIFLTLVLGFILVFAATHVFGAIATLWEKHGIDYTWVRLDKRFGPFIGAVIMIGGTILFLVMVALLAAIFDYAQH